LTTIYNFTELTNTTSILGILKFVDSTDYMGGFFILLALLGFVIVLFTNYEYFGGKEAFVLLAFLTCNITGLFYLAGLASIMLLVGSLVLMVVSILVYFLTE